MVFIYIYIYIYYSFHIFYITYFIKQKNLVKKINFKILKLKNLYKIYYKIILLYVLFNIKNIFLYII